MTHTPPSPNVWDDDLLANPHAVADKRRRVRSMFAAIAPSYDLNNRLHSLWMDQGWRRRAVKLADLKPTDRVVDVACGTGDLALRFERELRRLGRAPPELIGVDFTYEMLPIAQPQDHARRAGSPGSTATPWRCPCPTPRRTSSPSRSASATSPTPPPPSASSAGCCGRAAGW